MGRHRSTIRHPPSGAPSVRERTQISNHPLVRRPSDADCEPAKFLPADRYRHTRSTIGAAQAACPLQSLSTTASSGERPRLTEPRGYIGRRDEPWPRSASPFVNVARAPGSPGLGRRVGEPHVAPSGRRSKARRGLAAGRSLLGRRVGIRAYSAGTMNRPQAVGANAIGSTRGSFHRCRSPCSGFRFTPGTCREIAHDLQTGCSIHPGTFNSGSR